MSFADYRREFMRVMGSVATKERKGRLDPDRQPYEEITPEEQALLEQDWRALSRKRGFSEEDINEYATWLILSGQRDLPDAKNDPWRRSVPIESYVRSLYGRLVEYARTSGHAIPDHVQKDYKEIRTHEGEQLPSRPAALPVIPTPAAISGSPEETDIF